jgi:hypothetical protein
MPEVAQSPDKLGHPDAPPAAPRRLVMGLLCAAYVGVANGSFMVPLKYANRCAEGKLIGIARISALMDGWVSLSQKT